MHTYRQADSIPNPLFRKGVGAETGKSVISKSETKTNIINNNTDDTNYCSISVLYWNHPKELT
jgi:hypothetical protein